MANYTSPKEESAGKYACLLYDSTLKTVLGSVEDEQLYIEIIEFLIPGKHISSITNMEKEKHGLVVSEKVVIFDLLCKDDITGEEFLVEVQNAPDGTYKDRALYYSLVPIREQLEKKRSEAGTEEEAKRRKMDYSLKPVYIISLVNFGLKHESAEALEDGYVSRYELRNGLNGEKMTEALNFVFVEMGRLPYSKDEADKCKTRLERFIFTFKYMHTFEEYPASFEEDPLLEKLAKAAELANMTVEQRAKYDSAMNDEFARLVETNYAREQAREEGLAEGREKGRAEERMSFIATLHKKGYSISEISSMTDIPEAEVFSYLEKAQTTS